MQGYIVSRFAQWNILVVAFPIDVIRPLAQIDLHRDLPEFRGAARVQHLRAAAVGAAETAGWNRQPYGVE